MEADPGSQDEANDTSARINLDINDDHVARLWEHSLNHAYHHTCIHAFDKRYWRMRAGEGEGGAEEGRLSIKGLFHVAGKGAM